MDAKKRTALIMSLSGLLILILLLYFGGSSSDNNKKYYSSYEMACEDGDFQAAHELLIKLKEDFMNEKEHEQYHQIKKEKKSHWFKDDEYEVDSASVEDHAQFMRGLLDKGRKYLAGLDFVYNAEIAYVKELDEEDSPKRIKHLLSELRSNLHIFKSLEIEEDAQDVYNNMLQKLNMQSVEITDSIM